MQRPLGAEGKVLGLWTHLRCEGSEGSEGSEGRVDAPPGRGFLRFLSLTAFQAEGCGIARRAMSIKSALRDLLSVSYDMISILVISRYAAPPYPAAPDFPPSGGQNKTPQNILFISISTVSTGYCATSKRGKGGGASHQRGNAFPRAKRGWPVFRRAKARLLGFIIRGRLL